MWIARTMEAAGNDPQKLKMAIRTIAEVLGTIGVAVTGAKLTQVLNDQDVNNRFIRLKHT